MATETHITVWVILKNLLYIPAVFIGLSVESYGVLAALIVLDVVTGIWRVAVIEGGDYVTSWKAINGLVSKFLFLLIPVTVAYMGHGMGIDLIALAKTALSLLTLATGYSIIGNIYGIRTGKVVKEFDAVRLILGQIERLLAKVEPPHDKGKN